MPKWLTPELLGLVLEQIAARADRVCLTAGVPRGPEDAAAPPGAGGGRLLASRALRPGPGMGDFMLDPGPGSDLAGAAHGPVLTLSEQSGLVALSAGTATHVAILAGDDAPLVVTPLAEPHALEPGDVLTLAALTISFGAPD